MAVVLVVALFGWSLGACTSAEPRARDQSRPPSSAAQAGVEAVVSSPQAATPQLPRVLLVGDSTLQAVERYGQLKALVGFDYVFSAESCRTLGVPSCGDPPIPPNAVETITASSGPFDVVVVMAGYDEWWTSFPGSFDEVVAAARAKGASHVVWLTYREGVGYVAPDGSTANEAFVRNNETLRAKAASVEFGDVVLADWFTYSAESTNWLTRDGIHLTRVGARAVADFISRKIAHVSALPCPLPYVPGEPTEPICPDPDVHGPPPDLDAVFG